MEKTTHKRHTNNIKYKVQCLNTFLRKLRSRFQVYVNKLYFIHRILHTTNITVKLKEVKSLSNFSKLYIWLVKEIAPGYNVLYDFHFDIYADFIIPVSVYTLLAIMFKFVYVRSIS